SGSHQPHCTSCPCARQGGRSLDSCRVQRLLQSKIRRPGDLRRAKRKPPLQRARAREGGELAARPSVERGGSNCYLAASTEQSSRGQQVRRMTFRLRVS